MSAPSRIGHGYIVLSTAMSAAIILVIIGFLLIDSRQAISQTGWQLFTYEWNPADEKFGVLSLIYGTAAVTIIALGIALPLGLASAIFTSELLPDRFRLSIKSALELLAGIPSIVYGLLGVAFLNLWVENLFDLQSGRTIFTGGLLLAIMVLPTVITLGDDALHHVPQHYREAARSLGFYPHEVFWYAVLPPAKSDLIGVVLLALGRVVGETMAVMLVIGSIDKIPSPFGNVLIPGQTLTSKLGREVAESSFGSAHFSALIFIGLLLLVFVLLITVIALAFTDQQRDRLYE